MKLEYHHCSPGPATLLAFAAALLVSGCRSVDQRQAPVAYPLPPVPLSQFVRGPADGIYSLPESVVSQYNGLDLKIIIVSGGKIRLSCLGYDGHVGTNDWNYVEFKSTLPSDEALLGIASGTTEQEIERNFGKPTWVQPPNFKWKESMSGQVRVAEYTWFTVSPMSELILMRLVAIYNRTDDGGYAIKHLHWAKWQDRKLSSNYPAGGNAGSTTVQRGCSDAHGLSVPWTWNAKFEGISYEFNLPEAACLSKTRWDPEKGAAPLTPRQAEDIAIKQAIRLRPDVPGWTRNSFELVQVCDQDSWIYVVHLIRGDFFMGLPEVLSIPVLMSGMAVPVISTNAEPPVAHARR